MSDIDGGLKSIGEVYLQFFTSLVSLSLTFVILYGWFKLTRAKADFSLIFVLIPEITFELLTFCMSIVLIYSQGFQNLSQGVCNFWGIGTIVSCLTMTLGVYTLSLDRYLIIVKEKNRVADRRTALISVFVAGYFVSFVVAALPFFMNDVWYSPTIANTYCVVDWAAPGAYKIVLACVGFVVVVFNGMCFNYYKIYKVYRQASNRLIKVNASSDRNSNTPISREDTALKNTQKKLLKLSVFIVATYSTCWMPYCLYIIICAFMNSQISVAASVATSELATLTPFFSFFVIFFSNSKIRNVILRKDGNP